MYLDNIIIWSKSVKEHKKNITLILQALKDAHLFCSMKRSALFCMEIDFLGHHISEHRNEADLSKVDKILTWPVPRKAKHV